jgi:hypothetical protein
MTTKQVNQSMQAIGLAGEQILSYLDEISRTPCPKCGEAELGIELIGNNVVIRCSPALSEYNDCVESSAIPYVCDYTQVIKKTNLSLPPFNLKVGEKRGTARNSKGPTRPRGRPRKFG